ncbi:carboxylate/amino acid/amine transporter [Rickettsiales bacterium Ac37b]|nr:carboxylate/amino acid/amine transporter [Rickettsiales bacterium Ac37b]
MLNKQDKQFFLGILFILLNNLVCCIQQAINKMLLYSLSGFQIAFLYKFFLFLCIFCYVLYKGIKNLRTHKLWLHFLRSILSITGTLIFIHVLKFLSLAESSALLLTEPLFMSILAVVFLREYINKNIIVALLLGCIGSLIIIRPGALDFNIKSLWVIVAALVWAIDNLTIKLLGRTEKPIQYLFYISLFSWILAMPFSLYEWKPVKLTHIPWMVMLALLYFIHLIAVFRAFSLVNLPSLAPFDFSRVIFSSLLGYIIFREEFDIWVIIGSIIIVSSYSYILKKNMIAKYKD